MEEKINELKNLGNAAFKGNNFDEALVHYSDALKLSIPEYPALSSILLSNRAQLYLKQENPKSIFYIFRFELALKDANESLEFDPNFKKSMLRRATANYELKRNDEAMNDLRILIKLEPKNKNIRDLIQLCYPPTPMNEIMRKAYISQFFRRFATRPFNNEHELMIGAGDFGRKMKFAVSRQLFLSTNNLDILRQILNDTNVITSSPAVVGLLLPRWFSELRMRKENNFGHSIGLALSDALFSAYLELIPPAKFNLVICQQNHIEIAGPLQNYSEICHALGSKADTFRESELKAIQEYSQILTRLPYCPEIKNFRDTTFPNVNSLLVVPNVVVSQEFLKLWQQRQWKIQNIVFSEWVPNLENFHKFNGVLSDQLTKIHLPFLTPNSSRGFTNAIEKQKISDDLAMFKRIFPSLNEVEGVYSYLFTYHMEFEVFTEKYFEKHAVFLANEFNQDVKPAWCNQFNILINYIIFYYASVKEIHADLDTLRETIKKCRRELGTKINYIRLSGPEAARLNCTTSVHPFIVVEMETKWANFQFQFKLERDN